MASQKNAGQRGKSPEEAANSTSRKTTPVPHSRAVLLRRGTRIFASVPAGLAIVSALLLIAELLLPERNALPDDRIALANYLATRQVQIAQMSERLHEDAFLPHIALVGERTVDGAWLQAVDAYAQNLHGFLEIVDSPLDGVVAHAIEAQAQRLADLDRPDAVCQSSIARAADGVAKSAEGILAARNLSNRLQAIRQRAASESLKAGDPVELTRLISAVYSDKELVPLLGGIGGGSDPRAALVAIVDRRGAMIETIGTTIEDCRQSYDDGSDRSNARVLVIKMLLIIVALILSLELVRRDVRE